MGLTRGEVVRRAATVFRRRGFHAASMAEVAAACGILKGSLYHHFPSKDDLALAVLEHVHAQLRAAVFVKGAGSAPATARMQSLTRAAEEHFAAEDGACLVGLLALEVGAFDERFAVRLRACFDEWAAALAAPLDPVHGAAEALRLGRDFVARTQGALMLLKVSGDEEPLLRCHAAMVAATRPPGL